MGDAMYEPFAAAYARHVQDSPHNAHHDRPSALSLLGDVQGKTVLGQLLEPRPTPEIAIRYPDDFARLDTAPGFLTFRLVPKQSNR